MALNVTKGNDVGARRWEGEEEADGDIHNKKKVLNKKRQVLKKSGIICDGLGG